MSATPTPDMMCIAAEWLCENESEGGTEERIACQTVAKWLHKLAESREANANLKKDIIQAGMTPTPQLIKILKKRMKM